MTRLYYMRRKASPAKIEVGVINEEEVILPLAHFVWDPYDAHEWTPDLVITSTNWGLFNQYPEFITKLGDLSGIVLKPDMLCERLEELGCEKAEAADYADDFAVDSVFSDPDLVGSSEYRAIYDTLADCAETWEEARAILEEFKEQADAMLATLNQASPDV